MCDYLRMVTLGTRVPHEMEALNQLLRAESELVAANYAADHEGYRQLRADGQRRREDQ